MKEFVAKVGGRYTYVEDFLYMQELALSATALFSGCSNFIISGCETSGLSLTNITISPGLVFLNGKIRPFAGGTADLTRKYYIVESNTTETVKYAQEAVQQGRNVFGCFGSSQKPEAGDYIELSDTYIPRLKDCFFGKYALVLEPSTPLQTVRKKVVFENGIDSYQDVTVKGNILVRNGDNSLFLRHSCLSDSAHIEMNADGMQSRIVFEREGCVRIQLGDQVLFSCTKQGIASEQITGTSLSNGVLLLSDRHLVNIADNSDSGETGVNYNGYQNGISRFRNFTVYDGKHTEIFKVSGESHSANLYGPLCLCTGEASGLTLECSLYHKLDKRYEKRIVFTDRDHAEVGSLGYQSDSDNDLGLQNIYGEINLSPKTYVQADKPIKEQGTLLSEKYAPKSETATSLAEKVDRAEGKGLSTEDFTTNYKAKLEQMTWGKVDEPGEGFATTRDVSEHLAKYPLKENHLGDLPDMAMARKNLEVYSKTEADGRFLQKENLLSELSGLSEDDKEIARGHIGASKSGESYNKSETYQKSEVYDKTAADKQFAKAYNDSGWVYIKDGLYARQIGNIVCVSGNVKKPSGGNTWFMIPVNIGAPGHAIGGSFIADINSGHKYNRGLKWYCNQGSRDVRCSEEDGSDDNMNLLITYMV